MTLSLRRRLSTNALTLSLSRDRERSVNQRSFRNVHHHVYSWTVLRTNWSLAAGLHIVNVRLLPARTGLTCHIEMKSAELLRDSLNQISFTALSILCLGLGSPTSSRDARAQLAFLVQLCDTLNIVCTPLHIRAQYQTVSCVQKRQDVFIYDPVFTGEDVILLCDLQFQTLIENNARTCFFMCTASAS